LPEDALSAGDYLIVQVPLSLTGIPEVFAKAVTAYRDALEAHMMGRPGKPAPVAPSVVAMVVERQPQEGPVADRGPDRFVILPYTIIDDTPRTPEQQLAIDTLRDTIIK
jgi:hypothetical protein